jgi:hypothetical protein
MNAEDESMASLANLCEIERVLGRPQGGANAGRFPYVNYEAGGHDLRHYWHPGMEEGANTFAWSALKSRGEEYLLSRPDVWVYRFNLPQQALILNSSKTSQVSQIFLHRDASAPIFYRHAAGQ